MLLSLRGSQLLTCFAGLALAIPSLAQSQQPIVPTIAFNCDFPASNPSHYGFSVTSNRSASYTSDGKVNKDAAADPSSDPEEPFHMDLTLSSVTTDRIFALAKTAHYFEGNLDSRKKNIASTGDKTLSYRDVEKSNIANYNYSLVPAVQELTLLFQDLASAVEFGRRLEYEYRYQKLALDEEMKRMEETIAQETWPDLPAADPILQKILDDPSVINTVRARAQRLLQHAAAKSK